MKLSAKTRKQINADLIKWGMDGNGRFETPGCAMNAINHSLNAFGFAVGDLHWSATDTSTTKTMSVEAVSDNDLPDPVENLMLIVQTYTHAPGRVEALAYLS